MKDLKEIWQTICLVFREDPVGAFVDILFGVFLFIFGYYLLVMASC